MTSEPGSGSDPDSADAPGPEDEPDHWQRKAEEQASEPQPPQQEGAVFNPQGGRPSAPGPYGPPTYPAPPGYPQGYPGQAYGGPTGQPTSWEGHSTTPRQPQAGTALILGLVGLLGALFTCGASLLLSPVAWGVGRSSLSKIRASGGHLSGQSDARTGMVLGIIGSVLLVLGILAVIAFLALVLDLEPSGPGGGFDEGTDV